MTAAVTEKFKKQVIQDLYDDVTDSANTYFIGIGRSEVWDDSDVTPTQTGARRDDTEFRLSMQSVIAAETISFVVPRSNWSSGTIYNAYNDNITGIGVNDYYVLTDSNAVYICLEQGKDATGATVSSTVQPTSTTAAASRLGDGYVWKYLYTLGATAASSFLSANYMPVKLQDATDSTSSATDVDQETIQNAAVSGQIASVRVVSGGTGYGSAPTVSFDGDGTGAAATAVVSGGSIVKITMNDSSGTLLLGSGYTYAKVNLTGGSPTTAATAEVVISPGTGFGADPRDDLKASGIMFNAKPSGAESDDFIIGNDFRQVGLLKNVTYDDSSSVYGENTGIALNYLAFSTVTTGFTVDRTIEGATSGAKAIVDRFDNSNDYVYYHQNYETGFVSFTNGENVTEVSGSGAGTLDSPANVAGDVNPFSGDLLYIENRAAIDRAADQTEDIKLVIKF